jgi:hypothetical protein
MMKPKGQTEHEDGLLEYLEDIIGSNRYLTTHTICTVNCKYVCSSTRVTVVGICVCVCRG